MVCYAQPLIGRANIDKWEVQALLLTANLGELRHPFIRLERVLSGGEGCLHGAEKGANGPPNLQCYIPKLSS